MRKRATVSIWTIFFLFIVGCQCNSMKTGGFLQDLDYYVDTVYEVHADPFRKIPERDFSRNVEALRQFVLEGKKSGMSNVEWYYHLQELAASMQDGHTNIRFPSEYWSNLEPIFPFRLKIIDGDVYVIEKWGKDTVPLFSQILEINQIPMQTLLMKSSKLYSTSLDHAKEMWFEIKFSHRLSTYLGLKAPWRVRFQHDDEIETATVEGMTSNEYLTKWRNIGKSQYREYSFTVDSDEVPVLDIPSYSYGDEADYYDFIDRFFEKYKESQYLVIDLRLNGGGNGHWGYYLLDYLSDVPYLVTKSFKLKVSDNLRYSKYAEKAGDRLYDAENGEYLTVQSDLMWTPHTNKNRFRGKVFLLISERTFSAGAVTAAIFKFNEMGTIIGYETSGREKMCSDPVTIELPYSKLKASIPVAIFTLPGDNPDRGVIPDVEINYSIKDFENGIDKEIEKVKELVREAHRL